MDYASRILDDVQHLAQLDALDPTAYVEALAADLADDPPPTTLAGLGAELDRIRGVLEAIDKFTAKAMRIRLVHGLAHLPVTPQFHTYLIASVTSYAGDTQRLRDRLRASIGRSEPQAAEEIVEVSSGTAERVLAGRERLRAGVLELVRTVAAARIPLARECIKDVSLPDKERGKWRRALVDLGALTAAPARLDEGSFDKRLAAQSEPEVEPEPEPDAPRGRFDGIEID